MHHPHIQSRPAAHNAFILHLEQCSVLKCIIYVYKYKSSIKGSKNQILNFTIFR